MICQLTKWFVSNASDRNRALPKFARSHLHRCPSCQEFYRITNDLDKHAASEARSILRQTPPVLIHRLKDLPPAHIRRENLSQSRRKLLPILSVSAAFSAVVLFSLFILIPQKQAPLPPSNENFSFLFSRDSLPGGTLQKLATQVNTPFNTEWIRLRNAVQSASRYLTDQLTLKIEPPLNQ